MKTGRVSFLKLGRRLQTLTTSVAGTSAYSYDLQKFLPLAAAEVIFFTDTEETSFRV